MVDARGSAGTQGEGSVDASGRKALIAAVAAAIAVIIVVAVVLPRSGAPTATLRDGRAAVEWTQLHGQMWIWMRAHWTEMTQMHQHWGDTAWMRAHLPDWNMMRGRWGDMVWLHEHWQWTGSMPGAGMMGGLDPAGMMGG